MRSKICGQSLNGWTIFIGFVFLIQALIISTIMIVNLVKYKEDKTKATSEGEPYDEDREVVSTLCVSLSISLSFIVTTSILLWGAYIEKHLYLMPWLYNSILCIVVNSIYLLVIVLKNIYKLHKTKADVYSFLFIALTMTLGLILQIVFYRIVYKFYKELLSERALEHLENASTISIVYEEQTINQRFSSLAQKIISSLKCFK